MTVVTRAAETGRPELADVFRTHGHRLDGLSEQQRKAAAAIMSCRTAALGGHLQECDDGCGYQEISYNSCRNRHCPKCQGLDRVRWQEARAGDLLPVPYFHLVFTVPSSLQDVFLANPQVAYGLLFAAVAGTVKEVAANPENLGADIGMTTVLHTWTQTLLFHPHVHCVVPGGGLDPTGRRWIPARKDFVLAVRILSTVFRAKLLGALRSAVDSGEIESPAGDGADFVKLLRRAARRKWVVYCKRPFAGPEQVLAYLGRYTHRIAMGNERIVSTDGDEVTFAYKDRADGNRRKLMTLPAETFLRRFLLHVLPRRFVRIRHYGFLANSVRRDRMALCRRLLGVPAEPRETVSRETWKQLLLRVTGRDVTRCPRCGKGHLHSVRRIEPSKHGTRIEERAASP